MDRARIKVDFNEMVAEDLVLLSKTDNVVDSEGNEIHLVAGNRIYIYEYNKYENGEEEYLLAEGSAELNDPVVNGSWTQAAKWCCRISSDGIANETIAST